jgi:hypothetical protein
VLADNGHEYEEGMDVSTVVTKEMRESIQAILCEGFRSGKIEFKSTPSNQEKLASPAKLDAYVSGLISNWFRKDPNLNGNTKYEAKNPGSRAGSTDPQLKALRQLAPQFKGTEKEAVIAKQIETRLAFVAQEKAKKITIDLSVLSPELKEMLGIG